MTPRHAARRARAFRVLPGALIGASRSRARPVHLHLEHTTRCDHVCVTCIRASVTGEERDMPLAQARALLDAVAPAFVSLNGVGEPLLHPDWDAIARHAIDAHGARVGMASTGTHVRAQADRLVASGLGLLKISLHGALPATFTRLSGGRSLEVVEDGLSALRAARRAAGRGPSVRLNFLVTGETVDELAVAVDVAARTEADAVFFKGALAHEGRRAGLTAELPLARLRASVKTARARARSLGVRTNLSRWSSEVERVGSRPPEDRAPPGRCLIPWISVFVRVDGQILPCCNSTWHPQEGHMGRIGVDGSFEALWRSEGYATLRGEMRDGGTSLQACRGCPDPVTSQQAAGAALQGMWPGFLQ